MWNTGLNSIGNSLEDGINILDLEDHHYAITVGSNQTADFKSVIFPWCSNIGEVKGKAFAVSSLRTGAVFMYLFQDYKTNHVCWSVDIDDPWGHRVEMSNGANSVNPQQPLPDVDIVILPDKVWALPSEDESPTFNTIFSDTVAALTVLVGVIGRAVPKGS